MIPEHWKTKKLKFIIEYINGYAFDSSIFSDNGDVPVFRIGDINGETISFENVVYVNRLDKLQAFETKENDILLAMSGATVGKLGFCTGEKGYINQRVGIIRAKNSRFIFYALKTNSFIEYIINNSLGSAQPNISAKGVENFIIAVPNDDEINNIVMFLDRKISVINNLINKIESQISLLQERKQIIINEVVTGKVKVS